MKTKRVNQYQCEYCGKKNYSAPHMRTHEEHCTMNPNRKCRMCDRLVEWAGLEDQRPVPMVELLNLLPKPIPRETKVKDPDPYGLGEFTVKDIENIEEINNAIVIIQKRVECCPACTLAVIRQKGIPVNETRFEYGIECREFWSD